jgi:hypothetical protein
MAPIEAAIAAVAMYKYKRSGVKVSIVRFLFLIGPR